MLFRSIDIAKRVLHLVGMDARGKIVLRRRCSRGELLPVLAHLGPTTIVALPLFYRVPPWPQAQTASNRMPVEDRGVERLRGLRWRSTGLDEVVKTRFEW